ncbi:hypothetical protein ZWY2020_038601 [Hordeum vulgare]|nr:hypothetical protein ZWY2020_038601 [Hordeum vulgare]
MSSEKGRERIGSAANVANAILHTLKSLFKQDNVTGMASVQLWVLLTTVLLVWRFVLDFSGPWFGKPSRMVVVVTLKILKQNLVNDYFQMWAVLLVILQYNMKTGRPYTRSKQVPMLDLMSSFWSANLLRVQTFNLMRVVSDYMSYEDDLSVGVDLRVADMKGYKYLVHGEHRVLKKKVRLEPDGVHNNILVTVDKIWHDTGNNSLLGEATDPSNQRKDLCLSFSLYKMLRRQFYDLPVHELRRPQGKKKIRKLFFDYILRPCLGRVEMSFLQDLFYIKQVTVFADGLMILLWSLLLSLSFATATGYIAYSAPYIPKRMDPADPNRITHGVSITSLMVGIIVLKELLEIVLYVLSRWAKVLVLCKYVQRRCLQCLVVEMVMRFMQFFSSRTSLLHPRQLRLTGVVPPLTWRLVLCQGELTEKTALNDYTKIAILDSLKKLEKLKKLDKEGQALDKYQYYFSNTFKSNGWVVDLEWSRNLKVDTHIILVWHIATGLCEINFFNNVEKLRAVWRSRPFVQDPNRKRQPRGPASPQQEESEFNLSNYCAHLVRKALVPYNPIVAGMVLDEVIKEIDHLTSNFSWEKRKKPRLMQLRDVHESLRPTPPRDPKWTSVLRIMMGAELGERLVDVYQGDAAGLWRGLANFWTGFLLHLAMNTSAATHGKHLAGHSELITHLVRVKHDLRLHC